MIVMKNDLGDYENGSWMGCSAQARAFHFVFVLQYRLCLSS
jgi:hypothetical protein